MNEPVDLDVMRARAVELHGPRVAVLECGGRVWCLAVPASGFRVLWQRFKADGASPDPSTKVDAGVRLARAMLVPVASASSPESVKAEREAFDAMGEEAPALLDLLAEAAEGLGLGPLPIRAAAPPTSGA